MRRSLPLAVLLLAALCALGACTALTRELPPGDPVVWDARRAALTPRSTWQLEGRVAIAAADEGYSGTLAWDQQGEVLDFRFDGPLGFGGLHIHGDAAVLTVTTSKGETFTVTDPERELDARFGWSLPVHSMRYWLVGIPDPGSAFDADYDAAGKPRRIAQGGWTARYETWQPNLPFALPRKLVIERDDVRIKVVAESWRMLNAPEQPQG